MAVAAAAAHNSNAISLQLSQLDDHVYATLNERRKQAAERDFMLHYAPTMQMRDAEECAHLAFTNQALGTQAEQLEVLRRELSDVQAAFANEQAALADIQQARLIEDASAARHRRCAEQDLAELRERFLGEDTGCREAMQKVTKLLQAIESERYEMEAEAQASKIHAHREKEALAVHAEIQEEAVEHERLADQKLYDVPRQLKADMVVEREEHRAFQRRELLRRYQDGVGRR